MKKHAGYCTLLGTGASGGIPLIGCHCAVCQSKDPRNQRMRSSIFVEWGGNNFLVDSGPDVRQQLLKHKIEHVDALILTHLHYDHTAGIDELRPFYYWTKKRIPCFLSMETLADIRRRCDYLFEEHREGKSFAAQIEFHPLNGSRGSFSFGGQEIIYTPFEHGTVTVHGFRFGNLAYISDIKHYSDTIFEDLAGVETLIISSLRVKPSELHFNVEEAIAFADRLGVKQAYLMHMNHEVDHETVSKILPPHVQLGYDGLRFPFS